MALRDLSVLRNALLEGYNLQSFDKDTVLPSGFPQIIPSIGSSKVNYNKYTFSIVSASGLYIYFPNQLWFVANNFVELYNELIAYHDKLLQVFGTNKNTTAWQNVKNAKNADSSAPAYIFVENALRKLADPTDEALLLKFITDYNWWGGGKGLERTQNDYYVSPIMSAAGLVNDSQGLLSTMCVVLAQNPKASQLLKHFIDSGTNVSTITFKTHPLQQIFYGAPGTGKSHGIFELTKGHSIIRTTFHPDSDYSTFVGAYKPVTKEVDAKVVPVVLSANGTTFNTNQGTYKENLIKYEFVKQAFMKAYLLAWHKYTHPTLQKTSDEVVSSVITPQFLIIEEINRGNCAQIFGDLFQLLDRQDNGFSCYPIEADTDMQHELANAFTNDPLYKLGTLNIDDVVDGYTSNSRATLSEDIKNGRILLLPPNLFIWATMNTSDQSLFPIDSAFKRRWDWKYIKIKEGKDDAGQPLGWTLNFVDDPNNQGQKLCWWDFIKKLNTIIESMTDSADKQLGYFFCKANDAKEITPDVFVGKVVFYLWNDVFKMCGFDDKHLFTYERDNNGTKEAAALTFPDFYNDEGDVDSEVAKQFVLNVMNWKKN